jgi:hypothetical protein
VFRGTRGGWQAAWWGLGVEAEGWGFGIGREQMPWFPVPVPHSTPGCFSHLMGSQSTGDGIGLVIRLGNFHRVRHAGIRGPEIR